MKKDPGYTSLNKRFTWARGAAALPGPSDKPRCACCLAAEVALEETVLRLHGDYTVKLWLCGICTWVFKQQPKDVLGVNQKEGG